MFCLYCHIVIIMLYCHIVMLLPSVTVMEGVCKKGDQQLNQEIPENTVGSTLNLIIMSVILTFWQGKQMVYACMILGV